MHTLADDDDVFSQTSCLMPVAQHCLHGASAVDMGRVITVTATLKKVVPHNRGMSHGWLIVTAHNKLGDRFVESTQVGFGNGRFCVGVKRAKERSRVVFRGFES